MRRDLLLSSWYQEHMIGFVVDEARSLCKEVVSACWTEYIVFLASLCLSRGETFRQEFGQLGEVRCVLSESVKIMALTAIATKGSRRSIIRNLGMRG